MISNPQEAFYCEECGCVRLGIPGVSLDVSETIHKDAHFLERHRALCGIGAAIMIQAFVQWAVYGCKTCASLDNGECSKRGLWESCQARAYYENFLSMKE